MRPRAPAVPDTARRPIAHRRSSPAETAQQADRHNHAAQARSACFWALIGRLHIITIDQQVTSIMHPSSTIGCMMSPPIDCRAVCPSASARGRVR